MSRKLLMQEVEEAFDQAWSFYGSHSPDEAEAARKVNEATRRIVNAVLRETTTSKLAGIIKKHRLQEMIKEYRRT